MATFTMTMSERDRAVAESLRDPLGVTSSAAVINLCILFTAELLKALQKHPHPDELQFMSIGPDGQQCRLISPHLAYITERVVLLKKEEEMRK